MEEAPATAYSIHSTADDHSSAIAEFRQALPEGEWVSEWVSVCVVCEWVSERMPEWVFEYILVIEWESVWGSV
jgi:hypothetical protein